MKNKDNPIFIINENYDKLYKKEREIADIILDDIEIVMNSTIKELSNKADVSEATIIRFCKQLGYSGYSELKLEIAKASHSMSDTGEVDEKEYSCLSNQLYDETLALLNDYRKNIDYQTILDLAKIIYDSDLVLVYGQNDSGDLASYFVERLMSLGKPAILAKERVYMRKLSLIENENVISIFISSSGITSMTVENAKRSKDLGRTNIVLTKSDRTKLVDYADYLIEIPFYKTKILEYTFHTRIAFILILLLIAEEVMVLARKDGKGEKLDAYIEEVYKESYVRQSDEI